ncbi:hypothetical protein B0O99DRAFT_597106 [Bisporella sp. PMI_857]|nr:hypothetical protein B0O99DRAFT_597106 [Bisporella sp. PMI_857]
MPYEHTRTPAFEPTTMATIDSEHSGLVEAVAAMNMDNSSSTAAARNEPKNVESGGLDSGYASQSSTPDSLKSTFVDRAVASGKNLWPHSFRKPKQLRQYDKPISQLTWDRFSDLREQYAESLNHFTRSLPNCPSVLMTLQVLGEDEETAEPWVFVQCDKAVFKKISNFFKQPLIKIDFEPLQPDNRSPRLRVLVCPLKPRQLAKDVDLSSQHDPLADGALIEIFGDNDGIFTDTLCGTQIMNGHSHGMRRATMGGIIMVIDRKEGMRLFGMTAGHFLLERPCDESEDKLSDNMDDDFYAEESFELDLSSIKTNLEEEEEILPPAEAEDERGKKADLNKWSKVGKLSAASHTSLEDGRNLDWALITIDNYSFSLPNMLNGFVECKSGGPETNVIMLSARGPITGTLSSSLSYIMLPPGKVLVRTYLLSLSGGKTFQAGDSGAWVVDFVPGKVYGHVVASDVFGRGYVVPICDSFEDIKNRLSADLVSLPSRPDILTFNLRQFQLEPTSPVSYQHNPLVDPVFPIINASRRSVRTSFPAGVMPKSSRQSYHSSSVWTSPPLIFPSNHTPSSSIPGSHNNGHAYRQRRRTSYQVPDSGYSSMNTTPNHSPPVSPPQASGMSGSSQGSRGLKMSVAPASPRRPSFVILEQSGAAKKPIDPESDPTGELRAKKFKETATALQKRA